MTSADKRALVAFVHRGGGLVGFHSATDTFHHWPAYIRLMGAEFDHHPPPSTQRVTVVDRSTPMTRSLPPAFSIQEEFYVFSHDLLSRLHVLARLTAASITRSCGAAGPSADGSSTTRSAISRRPGAIRSRSRWRPAGSRGRRGW